MPDSRREVTLRFFAEPGDVNFGGKMFGGAVMKWIDLAAYACATHWAGSYAVTAYVGGIQFERPIAIGQLVEVRAKLLLTGRSSMHIAVDVYSRDSFGGDWRRTTRCLTVFVALDEAGKPRDVPAWEPQTDEDKVLADYAGRMKELSLALEAERARWLEPEASD